MKILAFDTSTSACSVALLNENTVKLSHQMAPMQQAKLILPMIHDLLEKESLTLNDLDTIAYGCGPGSFTGIRIAASVAQGIGFGIKKPIIPVSSLAALAQTAFLQWQWPRCLVAIDARSELIYWALYETNASGCMELKGKEQLSKPEDIKTPDNTIWYGAGDGWGKLTGKAKAVNTAALPDAQALLQLAKVKFERGDWVTPFEAIPVYLR